MSGDDLAEPRGERFPLAFAAPRSMNGRANMNSSRGPFLVVSKFVTRVVMVVVTALLLTLLPLTRPALSAEVEPAAGRLQEGHPGEGEHAAHAPSINPKTLGLQLLNFAVLLFILVKFGGGAINKALAARHNQLKADLESAAGLRAEAEAKLKQQEARLASLENEIAEMRRGIRAEADAEKARLIAAAEERAARIKAETAFLVEQQVREAEVRLRRESADSALKVAEEILRRSISAGDQQKLLDTFVADVERPAATGTAGAGRAV